MDLICGITWPVLISLGLVLYFVCKQYKKKQEEKKYELYNNTPKNKVILHCFPQTSLPLPSCVPWDLKIELFCRLAKIEYQKDSSYPFGRKGKTPWISINGTHLEDSQLILNFLRKKFNVNLNGSYTKEQLAIARATRVMLEERWYWAMPLWRFIRKDGKEQFYKDFKKVGSASIKPLWMTRLRFQRILDRQTKNHGIGRHSTEERLEMFLGDLRTVSEILGNKKCILGDEPCEDDCAIFGQIAQAVWGLPDSPYEKYVHAELPNLVSYCKRIQEQFWGQDWDSEY